jgi:hypothetical protein
VLFFRAALPPDQVLSPADAIFETPVYAGERPAEIPETSNGLLFDQVYQFTPWRAFAWESLRQGELPLWNPHSGTGTPFVATMQSAVFYPINLLLALVPFERTFVASAIVRLWLAGLGTWLLARRYGLAMTPALMASVAFMLSGFLVVWLGHPHTNVAVWLPWLVLAVDQFVTASERRAIWRGFTLLAVVVGLQFTGGHIETSVDILFAAGLYALVRWLSLAPLRSALERWRLGLARLAGVPAACLLGAGAAAVQLLPFLEWLPLSAEYQRRSADGFQWLDPAAARNLLSLPVAVFPNLYNNPTWDARYWSFNPWGNYNESALFIGTIPLALAVVALVTSWRVEPLVRVWAAVAAVSLGMALQLPPLDWLHQAPGLDLAAPGRLRLVTAFSLALLAGFGLQALLGSAGERARRWLSGWLAGVAVAGLLLLALGGVLLPRYQDRLLPAAEAFVAEQYENRETRPRSLEICQADVAGCLQDVVDAFRPANLEMYLPLYAALSGLALLLAARRGRATYLAWGLLAVAVVELVTFGDGYNPSIPRDAFYPQPPILAELRARSSGGRATVLQQAMYPDAQLMAGFSDVRSLDFPTGWYDDYLAASPNRVPWLANGVLLNGVDDPLIRVLGIRYVVTTDPALATPDRGLRLVTERDGVYLAEVVEAQPRAFLVYQAEIFENDVAALARLREDPALVYERVLFSDGFETTTSAFPPTARASQEAGGAEHVRLVSDSPRRLVWEVGSDREGFLVVTDAYYPGWRAWIDGEPAPIFRANVAFRAVVIPPGEHRVEFRYEPGSVKWGMAISVGCLVALSGLVVVMTIRPTPLGR